MNNPGFEPLSGEEQVFSFGKAEKGKEKLARREHEAPVCPHSQC